MASKKKASRSKPITKAKVASSRKSKMQKKSTTKKKSWLWKSTTNKRSPLLVMEREVKFSSLNDTIIPKAFNREGWGIMFKDFSPPMSALVKEFYENFHNQEGLSVKTIVKGVLITLTPAIIGKILGLPILSDVPNRESYETRTDPDCDEVMRFFTSDPLCHWPEKATTFDAKKFVNSNHRLGMNIMITNLYPTANRSNVTLPRMLFLYDIFNNRPIDLPHHLFHVMSHVSVKRARRYSLPFPSLVTKLLSHKDFNVPVPERFTAPKRSKFFGRSSLKSSTSHLHRLAPDLEHPESPNPIDPFPEHPVPPNPIDPFPENDATNAPQPPPAEPLLQAMRAFHDEMRQDMDRRMRAFHDEIERCMRAFHDEMHQDMDRRMRAFQAEMRQHISSMETRMAQQSDPCTRNAEEDFGAEDDEEGADPTVADDTPTASRHNLLVDMGDPLYPSSYKKKLLILDVNGLLLALRPNDWRKDFDSAFKRPFVYKFLQFCYDKFDVAVWSSRTRRNLDKLIKPLIPIDKLIFCWDQLYCINTKLKTLDCPLKPLFLKDLRKVWKEYKAYNVANTLLLDDSPYKALLNPPNTAVFPETYQYGDDKDTSLGPEGDLRMYLEKLAMAENVQKYVEQNPFGQRAITESDPDWSFYSNIINMMMQ